MAVLSSNRSWEKFVCLTVVALAIVIGPVPLAAQQSGAATDQERLVAERFLQVLMRRPRPGTALDRVYGFHVQNGTLDELIASLQSDPDADDTDAGRKAMILGLVQSQRGKSALAAEALQKAEQLLPDDAACSHYLGRAQLAIGQTELAAAAMERAIDRNPARNEALPIFTELGRIYGRAGQNEKALAVWNKLESLFPGDARVGGQIAATLAEEGNVQEAMERYAALAKSSRSEEDKIAFAVQAAEMQRRLGDSTKATEELESILSRLRPGSWLYTDVRNRIEDGFLKSGDYDALADYYQDRLAKDQDNLELQVRLGRILVSAGRLDEAAQTLQQAVERAPDDPEVRLALIDVLVGKGEIADASEQFERLAEQDPENPDYLLRWGQILLEDAKTEQAQRTEAAAKVWQRLAAARGDDAVTLSQIADRMRSIDRKDDAITLYRQAIEVDPQSPQYREYLGEYLHRLDRKEEAVEVWRSIAQGDRRSRDSLVRLAEVLGTFDLSDQALEVWREAAQMDLTFAQELRFAKKLRDIKQHEEALQRLDVAAAIAETPDEQEQLLKDRITTYQQAGTLSEQIEELKSSEPTAANLRQLALMHQAAGQLTDAAAAIRRATAAAPGDVDVLIVAADIAERQNRLTDAVETFQQLAKVDTRFRTNYLQRVADLQMRLGQVDDALATCETLIDANPASPETYQFYARLAFRAGRDEQAVTSLRRAMNVAPRDNAPRQMLASSLADRYRTDEAIELYWQAMQYETKTEDRITLVRQLAPLYDRKGEIDGWIRRIEEIGREDADARGTQLMMAAGYEAIQDYGAARQAIDRLLAQQPRDVTLLESMVRLCDLADEVTAAAEFQQRIVGLADTPENRFKLVQLKLDAGLIDVTAALSERISLASDPVRLGSMVRSAVARGDTETATTICREALKRDPSLWDIKLYLAQLLLQSDGEDREAKYDQAVNLCQEVRRSDFADDALPPTAKPPTSVPNQSTGLPSNYATSPMYWSQSNYEIARNYQLGPYGNANYGYSSSNSLVAPRSFGQARFLATSLMLVRTAKGKSGNDLKQAVDEFVDQQSPLPDVDQIHDAMVIWEHTAVKSLASMVAPSSPNPSGPTEVSDEEREQQEQLNWRLAELDPVNGSSALLSLLMKRVMPAAAGPMPVGSPQPDKSEPPQPLSEERLALLVDLYEQAKTRGNALGATQIASQEMSYRLILAKELERAGKSKQAQAYGFRPPEDDASLSEILSTIMFQLRLDQVEAADALVDRLLPAARETPSRSTSVYRGPAGTIGSIARTGETGREFVDRHRMKLLDAFVASAVRQRASSRSRSSGLSDGTIRAYTQTGSGSYRSIEIKGPLSTDLINQSIVSELAGLLPSNPTPSAARTQKFIVPQEIIRHLAEPLDDASPIENKSRQVLAAFAQWWADRPADCYQGLIKLCEQYPDDVDLQIERARLASELQQPRVALDALDSFDPLDSQMLVRKEMAAMNLASTLGDLERAKQAAERLFGMRMDTNTQLALADQLRRLGMNDKASAILRRLRGGRARTESTELQIANSFLAADDKASAAEVAYGLLRRLNSGRSQSGNATYYREQAVSILRTAGRLDPLIERAERRVKSSPKSTRSRIELAELYTAAGRRDDAAKLWEDIAENAPEDPRQLMARASSLYRAKKYKESAMMYLDAFEKQPQLFSNNYYEMTRAVEQAGTADEMFERLLKFNPASIPSYRVEELIRVGDSSNYSEAKRDFIRHILKNSSVQSTFYSLSRSIPDSEAAKIPELREVMVKAVCSDDAFSPTSTLWRVTSRGSGGQAMGPLDSLIGLLTTSPDDAKKFSEAAEKARETEASLPTADFLIALLELKKGGDRATAAQRIRNVIHQDDPDNGNSGAAPTISGGLLWQAGQVIEKIGGIDDRPSLLVAIYEAAIRDPQANSTSSFRYSIANRLVDSYAKNNQHDKAREYLLRAYADTDHSSRNRSNPGYGDAQELEAYQSIAEKLTSLDFPIDALAIYRRAISDPAKFDRSKRWRRNLSVEAFEKLADVATQKVTPKVAIVYLKRIGEEVADSEQTPAIDLLDLPIQALVQGNAQSGIEMAIESASTTEEGRDVLKRFARLLTDLVPQRSSDWSIPATLMLVAARVDAEGLPELAVTLMDRLPSKGSIAAAADKPAAESFRDLVALYTPAAATLNNDDERSKAVGRELVAYLKTVAVTIREPRLDLALSTLLGEESQSFAGFVAALEASAKPDSPLPAQETSTCLSIAQTAAASGDISLSTRALALALGNGPPLRKFGTSGDAFTITRSSSSSRDRVDDGMGELIAQVNEIVDTYSDATGNKLGSRDPKKEAEQRAKDQDVAASMKEIANTLQRIVIPESRAGSVFPYATNIASTNTYDRLSSADKITPRSLSIALGRAAFLAGQSEALLNELSARVEKASDKATAAAVYVDAAFAAQDEEALSAALDAFESSLDAGSRLPKEAAKTGDAPAVNVITSQMQQDSYRKSETINLVLSTVWPLLDESDFPGPENARRANDLLSRTADLISSDSYTAGRHREIATRIRRRMLSAAAARNDDWAFQKLLKGAGDAIEQQYASYPEDRRLEYRRRALDGLLNELVSDGMVEHTHHFARQMMLEEGRRDYRSLAAANFCLRVAGLPEQQRFDFLRRITMGDKVDQPIAHWSGFVRFGTPPPMLQSQTPKLGALQSLPLCAANVPVVDSLLMFADLTAQRGQSEQVADAIGARSQSTGDDADVAAAIVRLAAVTSDPGVANDVLKLIQPTLDAVGKHLHQTRPTKTDSKLAFPDLSYYLIVRAVAAGLPKQRSEPLLQILKAHAIRGQYNMMVSTIGRVIASQGIGRAAGATTASPLRHFAPVPLPERLAPDVPRLAPLFAINKEGWLSGTSGYGVSLLMLRYPVTGSFTVSANIKDGGWGESDLGYGGILYQPGGWNSTAKVMSLGNRVTVEFPVPVIHQGKENIEAISVSEQETAGLCNGEPYVTDITARSFPWVAVSHHMFRTTQLRDIKFSGEATIPREVNLIDPTMRGWRVVAGQGLPDPLIPIGPKQDTAKITQQREESQQRTEACWRVIDGELNYTSPASTSTNDRRGRIQYLRPLLDAETVEISFWWDWESTQLHPSIGRTELNFGEQGVRPTWLRMTQDAVITGYVTADNADPKVPRMATDNLPINESWNKLTLTRRGQSVSVSLNDKPLLDVPISEPPRVGIVRSVNRDVRIRSMKLTGDWPDKLPANLMERAD